MNKAAPLPNELYSPDLINLAIIELDRYASKVRDAETRKEIPPQPPSGLARVFATMAVSPSSPEDLDMLKSQLKNFLEKSQVVNIILSSIPSTSVKYQLTTWFRQQINPNLLINFSARADIGGGIIVQIGSRIYDFSFKSSLIANKAKIAELANV